MCVSFKKSLKINESIIIATPKKPFTIDIEHWKLAHILLNISIFSLFLRDRARWQKTTSATIFSLLKPEQFGQTISGFISLISKWLLRWYRLTVVCVRTLCSAIGRWRLFFSITRRFYGLMQKSKKKKKQRLLLKVCRRTIVEMTKKRDELLF